MSGADAVRDTGLGIFRRMAEAKPALFDRKSFAGRVMEAAMARPDLKVALFRFIDVLPVLEDDASLASHLSEYLLAGDREIPAPVRLLAGAATGIGSGIASAVLRRNVAAFARTFIVGRDIPEAVRGIRRIRDSGRNFTADLLGEAVLSEDEADRCRDRYLEMVDAFAAETAAWPPGDGGEAARFPRLDVSVKVSALCSRIRAESHDDAVRGISERLRPILRRAMAAGGAVTLDMETVELKEITLDVFTGLLGEAEFRGYDGAGIALQMYLRSAGRDVDRLLSWADAGDRRIRVRLVKGAYWEHEKTLARQRGWPVPVFTTKSHTDASFERNVERVLAAGDRVALAVATHNVRSIAAAIEAARRHKGAGGRMEFQMLYGMAEPVKEALGDMGHVVREYAPVGELIPGMAYLVRRLLENSSNEGFLRRRFGRGDDPVALMEPPEPFREPPAEPPPRPGEGPFANEPPLDFSARENRARFGEAIREVHRSAGASVPAVVSGVELSAGEPIVSRNPADPAETVRVAPAATREDADRAIRAASAAQPAWGAVPAAERAAILFRAAAIARARRFPLAALQVVEVGKSWVEADADVCEAIDFLEYYGREMIRLDAPRKLGDAPGEENRYFYRPRGTGVVVAPWNFPMAISTGMVSAALVAGNAVVYKPSSLSVGCGRAVYDILREAGVPGEVLHFLPGRGGEVGDFLVGHPEADFVLFTGSLDVGLGIVERAGRRVPGQRGPKKVVIETGGKNAIVVDGDADLDQAVPGVIRSAFGYQGQKCSACSRAIVLSAAYDRFLSRLAEAVSGLRIGPPDDPANEIGPVVEEAARRRIETYVERGKREGRRVAEGAAPPAGPGHYVSPVVFADLPPGSPLLSEEIFGPVLSVVRVRDLDEAFRVANDSIYALTGGLYSRSPGAIARAMRELRAGNLYVNRPITGAIVGRQPFGGFRMSGIGSKAGGPDYLLQFLEPVCATENTVRRGFSPEDA
jgi:RHH-type proline utilization regulon transcriptional repressor/proline dehydrogenase/delta 1-pyrroline-5-carboxylate dehydrogenase